MYFNHSSPPFLSLYGSTTTTTTLTHSPMTHLPSCLISLLTASLKWVFHWCFAYLSSLPSLKILELTTIPSLSHSLTHSFIHSLSLSLSLSFCMLETALRTDLVGYHDSFFLASSAKSDFLERDYQSSGRFQRCGRFQWGGWVGCQWFELQLSDA